MFKAQNILYVLLCSLFTCVFWLQITAQTPQPYPLEVPDDFSVKTIYELKEDKFTGDMWIGTEEGLYRYDGVGFQNYVHPDFSTDLSGVNQDSTGRIWCQNFSGQIFYVKGDSLELFVNHAKYENNFPTYCVVFPTVYISSSYGYFEVDFYTREKKRCYLSIDSTSYKINAKGDTLYKESIIKMKDNNGRIVFLKSGQFCSPFIEGGEQKIACTPVLRELRGAINFIFEGDKTLIFSSTHNSKKSIVVEWINYDEIKEVHLESFISEISPASLFQDGQFFWLGLTDGLVVLDHEYRSVYGEQKILEGKTISDIVKDKEGNYWIGTLNRGLYMLPSKDVLVWNRNNSPLQDNEITAILTDHKGNLYLRERKGWVWKLDLTSHSINFLCDFEVKAKQLFYDDYHNVLYSQYSNYSYDLSEETLNLMVDAAAYKDIGFIDEENMVFSHYRGVSIVNRIHPKTKLPMDSLWQNAGFTLRDSYGDITLELRNKRSAYNCYDPSDERIWAGYTNGLYQYKNAVEKEVKNEGNSIVVTDLKTAKEGGIWASTIQKQVLHIQDTMVLKTVEIGETILEVEEWQGYLFLATNKGVYKYDLEEDRIEIFNQLDGLPSDNITSLEIVNDTIYIATNNGVTFLPAIYSSVNTNIPAISIANVAIWEKDTLLLPSYHLTAANNHVKIEFKGRSIRSQGGFYYKYRMMGLDSVWVKASSNNNVVRYPSLPSGSYIFEVKTVNEDGVESRNPAHVQFFIDRPYYLKWWFIFLVVGLIAALVSSFFLARINIIKKRNELMAEQQHLETELSQSQLTALRSQMNPHFMFNALNSIQEYTLTNQKELASDYLGKFSDLMRLYLNHSRLQTISLQDELEALELYLELEQLRFEDSFQYEVHKEKNVLLEDIDIPSMLIQPYVENAIKHGLFHRKTNRKLKVSFSLNESNALRCVIVDNGVGRKQSGMINQLRKNKPNSFATSAIQNRLVLLNKNRSRKIEVITIDLFNDKQQASGTQVEIVIP